jgi:hypothetical protein
VETLNGDMKGWTRVSSTDPPPPDLWNLGMQSRFLFLHVIPSHLLYSAGELLRGPRIQTTDASIGLVGSDRGVVGAAAASRHWHHFHLLLGMLMHRASIGGEVRIRFLRWSWRWWCRVGIRVMAVHVRRWRRHDKSEEIICGYPSTRLGDLVKRVLT